MKSILALALLLALVSAPLALADDPLQPPPPEDLDEGIDPAEAVNEPAAGAHAQVEDAAGAVCLTDAESADGAGPENENPAHDASSAGGDFIEFFSAPSGSQAPAAAWTVVALGSVLGTGAGIFGTKTVSRLRSRRAATIDETRFTLTEAGTQDVAAHELSGPQLVERVRHKPFDGAAQFEWGRRLVVSGRIEEAVQHLEVSYRTYPEGVLRILSEPEFAQARVHPRLRRSLARFHRDQQHRLHTAYV